MATLNVTNTFTNGTAANATEVNQNFTDVKTFVEGSLVHADGTVKAGTVAIANGAITAPKIGVLTNTTAKTADYSLVLGDENTTILLDKSTTFTLTVPNNSTQAFAVGTQISFVQTGSGQVVFSPAGGVTINSDNSKTKILVQYGVASIIKTATNTWVLFGQLTA